MLAFANSCVGKPFSGAAMARSILFPRQTDGNSYFCAGEAKRIGTPLSHVLTRVWFFLLLFTELVADVLRHGGLLDRHSNPGAATPEGIHQLYKSRAATTANPYLLRQANCQRSLTTESVVTQRTYVPPQLNTINTVAQNQTHPSHTDATAAAMASTFHAHPLCPMHGVSSTTSFVRGSAGPFCQASNVSMATFPMTTMSRDAPLCGHVGAKSALRVLNAGDTPLRPSHPPLGLTLNSLNFRKL